MLGLSQHSIRMDWELMELCISVGRSGWLERLGLCSDRCKLQEVVGPFGKCGDRVYKGCEKDEDGGG